MWSTFMCTVSFNERMGFCSFSIFLLLVKLCLIEISNSEGSSWKSGPPDGLPELDKLNVECGKEEMTIHLEFTAPYDGTIYSKSNGQSQRCIHISPYSHITEATFSVNYHSCGTRSDSHGKYYENTIIIQYDDTVIEAWDEAKKIRCEWHDGYEKSAYKMPITISDLDVVEMNFQGDDVDCWLEVQDGKGPWSAKVEGLVPLGSPLTLVVAIQDSEGQFDMRVKSCIAHDGHKNPIHLTDEDGCVLRPKMMSPFQKTADTKGTASVIAYSHFYAFKFPETVEVTIQCTVEICRHGCPDTCLQGRDAQTANPIDGYLLPQAKDQDDIPTYKDTQAFSTIITSKPGTLNSSAMSNAAKNASLDTNSNETKNNETDVLKTSPDTHHDFYMDRYPYNLYDILEAEERQDRNDHMYTDIDESEYLDNTDNVFHLPNHAYANEQGKKFSPNQKIQNVSSDTENATEYYDIISSTDYINSNKSKEKDTMEPRNTLEVKTSEIHDDIDEEFQAKVETENPDVANTSTENPVSEDTVLPSELQPHRESFDDHTLNQLLPELFEVDVSNSTTETKELLKQSSPAKIKTESLHESDEEKNIKSARESDYKDESEYNDKLDYEYIEKRMIDNEMSMNNKLSNMNFENLKMKEKIPLDNNEMRHNLHNFNYKPFMPPAPIPPVTLYNGVPLYYYNHPTANEDILNRNGYQYIERQPYYKDYIKSKLRRPGTRRGRREIGEKEQLGLKQTLRVIATTDFDLLIKDDKKTESLYLGKSDSHNDVCIAPSSFAAGLGLLLLANISVLCVVIFLGHHYFIHSNVKAKNKKLLGTEMT